MGSARKPTRSAERRGGSKVRAVTRRGKAALQEMFDCQVCDALWIPSDLSRDETLRRMETAVAAVRSLEPRGILEKMLAVQIVASHNAAMDCLRRAALPGQHPQVWEASLKQADRLMAACQRQIEAFTRMRGKDTAGVVLGNILHVQPGGQALVQMQAAFTEQGDAQADPSALALEHRPVETLDLGRSTAPAISDAQIGRSPMLAREDERIERSAVPSGGRMGRRV